MSLQESYEMLTTMRDPIKAAFLESQSPSQLDLNAKKEGIAIIFFGAPFTDPVHAAYKLALKTDLPVVNIDQLIIRAIGSEVFSIDARDAPQKIYQLINAEYLRVFKAVLTPEILEEEAQMSNIALLERKLQKLKEGPPTLTGRSKKSNKSDKSSKKSGSSKYLTLFYHLLHQGFSNILPRYLLLHQKNSKQCFR